MSKSTAASHNPRVESHSRTALRNHIIQASTLLEILLSGWYSSACCSASSPS